MRCAVVLAVLWALAILALPARAGEKPLPTPPALATLFGGAFALVDQDGVARTDVDFRGKYLLVFFGYASCPDICPTDLSTIAAALDLLAGQADGVQPLFVTVDPARDTPEVLKEYVGKFHPKFIGLTGREAQIRQAAKAYRVHRSKILIEGEASGAYLANHSSLTYLMAPDGSFVTLFPHGTAAPVMAAAMRRHLGG